MKAQIFFFTLFRGEKVGQDSFGNIYYKTRRFWKKERRWVIYKGLTEASKVPPEWFGWLHFTNDAPLFSKPHPWVKAHTPNLSGTKSAYIYPSSIKEIPKRQIYGIKFWTPDSMNETKERNE